MGAEFLSSIPPGAVALAAVVLTVVSLALLYEAVQRIRRQQAVSRELEKVAEERKNLGRRPDDEAGTLLREQQETRFPLMEKLGRFLPQRADLQHLMQQADVDWSVGTLLVMVLGLAAVAGLGATLVAGVASWVPLTAAAAGAALPFLWLMRRRSKRFAAFEEMFPDAIDLLARAVKAGNAFSAGIRSVAEESPEPVAGEFRQVFEEQKFGMSLRETLLALADRVSIMDVRIFVTSVLIQRESGGNLVENLENLSSTIRERFKFRRQVKVFTAQGRMTAVVVLLVPFAIAAGLWMLNPEYMGVLFVDETGRTMLAVALGLQIMGFFVIRRLVRLDV